MAIGSAAELDLMLADLGLPVSYTAPGGVAQSTNGILDTQQVTSLNIDTGMTTVGRLPKLRIRDGSLTGLVNERAITVNGNPYHLRDLGDAGADGSRVLHLVEG
jgi:hypothetical protein